MLQRLGPAGLVGLLIVAAGIGLVAWQNWIVAAGVALVIAGLGLVVKGLISSMLSAWGMM